mgnify:CR=1 FL=1|tara:strand:- start:1745 stop:2707 length:963 start_codon:yes stop_codon:yes gene_type:complete
MDIIELFIDEEDEVSGIEAISVVENPAIESDFIALKNQEFKLAEVDKEKRILMGAALIPNKPIYRQSGDQEFYIYFSRDTVRKASELFFIKGNQNNATLEHQLELKGLTAVESWIVESEQDKSRMYDLNVPIGTWMVSMKVNNDKVWKQVKAGEVKGFSIEGYFADKLQRPNEPIKDKMSKEQIAETKIEELKQLFSTQKVELSSIDDLKKAITKIDNLRDSAYGINKDALVLKEEITPILKRLDVLQKTKKELLDAATNDSFRTKANANLKETFNKLSNEASELGVSPKSLPVYKDYASALKLIEETKSFIKDAISALK